MRKLIVLLGVALCVAAYFTLRTTDAPSLWELETSITNHDTGLEVGVETDKANLLCARKR